MRDTNTLIGSAVGPYQIIRQIGAGGMALVFLAKDLKHGRVVAFKVCRPELLVAAGGSRFLREVQTLARLTHPHILPLHDSGTFDDYLYYVTPYVEGESLRSRLDRGPMSVSETLTLAHQIADALDYAHKNNVIHRDVKPENVLLSGSHCVVADFGIAKAVANESEAVTKGALTETGVIIGSPPYMSPEQVGGDPALDGRSDQYSFACVVYEMLAGSAPFTGPTTQAVLMAHLTEPVPPLASRELHVPRPVEDVMIRALAKAPSDRFPSVSEFVRSLARAFEDTKSTVIVDSDEITGDASAAGRAARRSRTRRRLVAAGALAAVATGAWFAFDRVTQRQTQTRAQAALVLARGDFYAGKFADVVTRLAPVADDPRLADSTRRELLRFLARSYANTANRTAASNALKSLLAIEPPLVLLAPSLETAEMMRLYLEARREKLATQSVASRAGLSVARPVIALYPFLLLADSGSSRADGAGLATGTTSLILTGLASQSGIQVVEREAKSLRSSVRASNFDVLDPGGADSTVLPETHVLFGALSWHNRQAFISTWLVSVETGDLQDFQQVLAPDSLLLDLTAELTRKVVLALTSKAAVAVAPPPSRKPIPARGSASTAPPSPAFEPPPASRPAPPVTASRGTASPPPVTTTPPPQVTAPPVASPPASTAPPTTSPPVSTTPPVTSTAPPVIQTPDSASRPATKKMPLAVAMLYARAVEAQDSGRISEAITLYRQVLDKVPYSPAQEALDKLLRK